jgi:hypothetical protein
VGGVLLGGRGRLTSACGEIGICLRTLKRWRKALIGDGGGHDRREGSPRLVSHKLSEEERQRILLTCNQAEYASLPPGQIVPALADQGLYIGSESSFYRIPHHPVRDLVLPLPGDRRLEPQGCGLGCRRA